MACQMSVPRNEPTVDTATRYLMYSTTDNTSSAALTQKIRDEILFPFGKPTILRLDNAKYFKEHDFSIQQDLLQNQKVPKTPYKVGELVLVRDCNPKLSKSIISLPLEKRKSLTIRTVNCIRAILKDEGSNNIAYYCLEGKPCQPSRPKSK
uniref:Integrase catalytic domain-containing protein n=1 Tax=Strongyloides papillosus TaxID=174720 RepID=A0A0N5BB45_STREA